MSREAQNLIWSIYGRSPGHRTFHGEVPHTESTSGILVKEVKKIENDFTVESMMA